MWSCWPHRSMTYSSRWTSSPPSVKRPGWESTPPNLRPWFSARKSWSAFFGSRRRSCSEWRSWSTSGSCSQLRGKAELYRCSICSDADCTGEVFRACPTGRRPQGRPRTMSLGWPGNVLGFPWKSWMKWWEGEVWASLLRLLPPHPNPGLAVEVETGWMDGSYCINWHMQKQRHMLGFIHCTPIYMFQKIEVDSQLKFKMVGFSFTVFNITW